MYSYFPFYCMEMTEIMRHYINSQSLFVEEEELTFRTCDYNFGFVLGHIQPWSGGQFLDLYSGITSVKTWWTKWGLRY